MRIRTNRLTGIMLLQLVLQLALLFHTGGLLWADSRTGIIKHVSGRDAVISLGIRDGVTVGLRGEIFREEMVEGQQSTSKLAELTVTEAYPDSAMIEIRMRFAPVRKGDQVRVDNVIVPRTIVPEEEKPDSVVFHVEEREKPSIKYRIGLGLGYAKSGGDMKNLIDELGIGLCIYADRMFKTNTALGVKLSVMRFPILESIGTSEPFYNNTIMLDTKIVQLGVHVKYFIASGPVEIYFLGGPTFNWQKVEFFYGEGSQPDLDETDVGFGLRIGLGLDYPISESFLLGLEFDFNRRSISNANIEDTLEWNTVYYGCGLIRLSYRL